MIPTSWRTWLASALNNSPCEHFEAVTNNMALVALGQSQRYQMNERRQGTRGPLGADELAQMDALIAAHDAQAQIGGRQ